MCVARISLVASCIGWEYRTNLDDIVAADTDHMDDISLLSSSVSHHIDHDGHNDHDMIELSSIALDEEIIHGHITHNHHNHDGHHILKSAATLHSDDYDDVHEVMDEEIDPHVRIPTTSQILHSNKAHTRL